MANTQALKSAISGSKAATTAVQTDLVADLTALRAAVVSLLAKLDADAGVTDTNYASTLTPAALRSIL